MDRIECVVIGAGVVGLAVARAMAARGREVIVLEAGEAVGTGTSSRNSEVIHAGLYYPRGSLKADLCVRGRAMLYEYCDAHGVPYNRCGKLLVATARNQLPQLAAIQHKAVENGVTDLVRVSGAEAMEMEPQLQCVEAVFSPQTGIIDSHQFMLALQGDAERDGATVAFHTPVTDIDARDGAFIVETGGEAPMALPGRLRDQQRGAVGEPDRARYPRTRRAPCAAAVFREGQLFHRERPDAIRPPDLPDAERSRARRASHHRYGRPGQVRSGRGMDPEDRLRRRSAARGQLLRRHSRVLAESSRRCAATRLRRDSAETFRAGQPAADFLIQGRAAHGMAGLVNLFGIESPGLTASLAIAEKVAKMLG